MGTRRTEAGSRRGTSASGTIPVRVATSTAKPRLESFDVAKAIAIIAVITGHTAIRFAGVPVVGAGASEAIALTFTFHLPLFFFVSGYFLHTDRPFPIVKELKALILPYAITALAVVLAVTVLNLVWHDMGPTRLVILNWANAALYGAGDIPANPLWPQPLRIGAIWFLLAMFWSRLFTLMACRTGKASGLVVLALLFGGLLSVRYVFLPLSIQPAMCATLFVWSGLIARKYDFLARIERHTIVLVACFMIWSWAFIEYKGWGMAMALYGSGGLDIIRNCAGGIAATVLILNICLRIEHCGACNCFVWSALARMGTITLVVLCVHLFEDDVLRWGDIINSFSAFMPYPGAWMILNLVRVVIDVFIAWLIRKGTGRIATPSRAK